MISILVEGKLDEYLVKYLLINLLNVERSQFHITQNGTKSLDNDKLKEAKRRGEPLFVIFDADDDDLETRRVNLANLLEINQEQIFLLPNNQDKGEVEHLLFSCVPSSKKHLLDCYDTMLECMGKDLPSPLTNHDKIYAYMSVHLTKKESDQRKYIYDYSLSKTDIWQFEHNKLLQPLVEFLKKHFHSNEQ